MVIMLPNSGYIVKGLHKTNNKKIGLMMNPRRWWKPFCKYALDNDCFNRFDEVQYLKVLDKTKEIHPPIFITVPDVVGCHDRTLALWRWYYPILKEYGYQLAFVAQDGCKPELVPKEADWIFIGGKDPWKFDNAHKFIGEKPVHVGRVNGIKRLEYCEKIGVASIDGTGWMRGRDKKFYDLIEYIKGVKQCSMF